MQVNQIRKLLFLGFICLSASLFINLFTNSNFVNSQISPTRSPIQSPTQSPIQSPIQFPIQSPASSSDQPSQPSDPFDQVPEPIPTTTATTGQTSLEQLPTGLYYYSQSNQISSKRPNFVFFRKSGSTIIGWDHRSTVAPACFRGFIEGNQVINATRVLAPYQPDSQLQQGQTIDLATYSATEDTVPDAATETLQTCMNFFWR
jgi:hypothetical protein